MDQAPEGSIVITPKEFYDGVRQDITEIKNLLAPLPRRVDALETEVSTLKARVDAVDRRLVWVAGFAAGAGGTVGTLLTKFLG